MRQACLISARERQQAPEQQLPAEEQAWVQALWVAAWMASERERLEPRVPQQPEPGQAQAEQLLRPERSEPAASQEEPQQQNRT